MNYIPYDISTLIKEKSINPDIDRAVLAGFEWGEERKHNALYDAQILRACYKRLNS